MKAAAILFMISPLIAASAEPSNSFIHPPMPACAELAQADPSDLAGALEKGPKVLSLSCTEFAMRRLEAVADRMSVADSARAVNALMSFLSFQSLMTRMGK